MLRDVHFYSVFHVLFRHLLDCPSVFSFYRCCCWGAHTFIFEARDSWNSRGSLDQLFSLHSRSNNRLNSCSLQHEFSNHGMARPRFQKPAARGSKQGVDLLREVDEQKSSWFSWLLNADHRKPCYIAGWDELQWVPGLDFATGEVRSVLRSADSIAANTAVSYSTKFGLSSSISAQESATAAADPRVRCYLSQRACYFDGIQWLLPGKSNLKRQVDSSAVERIVESLPAGENLVTDTVILLVAGSVSREKLEKSLKEIIIPGGSIAGTSASQPYDFRRTGLVQRLTSDWNILRGGVPQWAKNLENPRKLLSSLQVHAAQMREVLRLDLEIRQLEMQQADENRIQSKRDTRDSLKNSLEHVGVEVDRARAVLMSDSSRSRTGFDHKLLLESSADKAQRARDLVFISGAESEDRVKRIGRGMLTLSAAMGGLYLLLNQ